MKKNFLWLFVAIFPLLAGCCNDVKDNLGDGVDDLAFMLNRLAPLDGKVYGVILDDRRPDILCRPVKSDDDALSEFYKLIPNGSNNKGVTKGDNGQLSYQLTDAQGNKQGSITYSTAEYGYCGEVTLSPELMQATGYSSLRYIQEDMWPPQSGGFIKDLLNEIKK